MSEHSHGACCCHFDGKKNKFDFLLWGSLLVVAVTYLVYWQNPRNIADIEIFQTFSQSVFDLINTIWWGVALGAVTIGILGKIPREFVISILGHDGGINGLVRATLGGVLLDLCSHGILMVGSKLYERGASTGQVIAFLVASPWNSFSLTIVLIALIGLPWTLAFIVLSMVIAIISGLIFESLTRKGVLQANPNKIELPEDFRFWNEAKKKLKQVKFTPRLIWDTLLSGIKDSRMVVRWILFGVILAGLMRAFMDPSEFQTFFGPTLGGLGLTLVVATILEVCSEGSTPVAADLLTRAGAPGNSFAFLMAGVATDYTEFMVLKDTTKSWKVPLFMTLVTVPQILVVAYIMNIVGV